MIKFYRFALTLFASYSHLRAFANLIRNRTINILKNCDDIWCCKNRHFNNSFLPLPNQIPRRQVEGNILVFSVWVGDKPLNETLLNHNIYCRRHGYEYKHFYLSPEEFREKYGSIPFGWYSVLMAKELILNSTARYFLKLDIDCIFARMDLRLESLIDPYDRYSIYLSQSSTITRFTSGHTWMTRNDSFALEFVNEWLEFTKRGRCDDQAMEQGALQLNTAYFYAKEFHSYNVTTYDCIRSCWSERRAFQHHQCAIGWLDENGFGKAKQLI